MIDQENYQEAERFYDGWDKKFIRDFVFDNLRQFRALEFVFDNIHLDGGARVLEFGSGIGSNGWVLSRLLPVEVVSMDLSESCIQTGKQLFAGNAQQTFIREDVLHYAKGLDDVDKFDCIIILDVLEHIRRENWEELMAAFNLLLKPTGEVFITCPTPAHQRHLEINNPGGLQPIDLSITREDYVDVAQGLKMKLLEHKVQTVWMVDDYHYAHIGHERRDQKRRFMKQLIAIRHLLVLRTFGLKVYIDCFDFSLMKSQIKRKIRRSFSLS